MSNFVYFNNQQKSNRQGTVTRSSFIRNTNNEGGLAEEVSNDDTEPPQSDATKVVEPKATPVPASVSVSSIAVRPDEPTLVNGPLSDRTLPGDITSPTAAKLLETDSLVLEPTNNSDNLQIGIPQDPKYLATPTNGNKQRYGNKKGVTTSWVWSHLKKDEVQKVVLCEVSVLNKEGEKVPCAHQFQMSTSTSNLATHLRSQHQIYDPSKSSAQSPSTSVVGTIGSSLAAPKPIRSPAAKMTPAPVTVTPQPQPQVQHSPQLPVSIKFESSQPLIQPPPPPPRPLFVQTVPERIKMHNKDKHNRLVAKLVAWLVEDLQPFSLIDNLKFRDFCQEMDPRFNFPSVNSLNTFTELELGDFIQSTPTPVSIPEKRSAPSTTSINSSGESVSPAKRLKSTSSWVWNHLKKDETTRIVTCEVLVLNEKNEEVKCGHLFQYSTSTSNLASHLRGTHRILDANTPYTPSRATTLRSNSTNSSTGFRTRSTPTRNNSKMTTEWAPSPGVSYLPPLSSPTPRQHPKEKQDRLIFKMVAWMVDDLQSFELLNSFKFREFCQEMDAKFVIPSVESIQQLIVDSANGIQDKLVHLIQNTMTSFSFTTELWAQKQNSFIAVFVHWISDKFIQLRALLGVGIMPVSPTEDQISEALKALFDRWQISNKLLATVTDNAQRPKTNQHIQVEKVLCSAHIIQLSIEAGLKKCTSLLMKTTALNDFLVDRADRHRERFYGIQAMIQPDAQLYNAVKQESRNWNSIFLVLERLLMLRSAAEVLQTVLVRDNDTLVKADGNDLAKLLLSDEEWEAVQELIYLLKPFIQVTQFMDLNEGYSSLAIMYPTILKLVKHLKPEQQLFKQTAILEVQKEILSSIMHLWQDPQTVGLLATLLDPRFKSLNSISEKKREKAHQVLREKVEARGEIDSPIMIINKLPIDYYNPLAAFFEDEFTQSKNQSEVDLYLRLPELPKTEIKDALEWWRENASKFPKLALQARTYLATPGTCVHSGRVFSLDTEHTVLIQGKRQQLDPNFVHYIMMLKENSILFENLTYHS